MTTTITDEATDRYDDMVDVYTVGPCATPRWRSHIDCTHRTWDPKAFNDHLLREREYNARMLYELTLLLEVIDGEVWTCRRSLEQMRTGALMALRTTEVQIATFQLLTQNVGLRKDRDPLYKAAAFAHSTHRYFYELFIKHQAAPADDDKKKKKRRDMKGMADVLGLRPVSVDSPKALVTCLDQNLHGVHIALKCGLEWLMDRMTVDEQEAQGWCRRLTLLVKALDDVFVVL
jgi:hypothetical protein